MSKYAAFDASVSPSPVIGWYDTDDFKYSNLPANLVELSDSQWATHFQDPNNWQVVSGQLQEKNA